MTTRWLTIAMVFGGAVAAQQTEGPIEAKLRFDAGPAKVELVAVCKASETEASCWGADGKSAVPEIVQEFKNAFAAQDYRYLPLRFGQKTRVAVFRVTNPPYGDDRVSIDSNFATSGNVGSNFDFGQRSYQTGQGETRVETRLAVILAGPTEVFGKVSTVLHRNQAPSGKIPLKEGAKLQYLGNTYTVQAIAKPLPKGPNRA